MKTRRPYEAEQEAIREMIPLRAQGMALKVIAAAKATEVKSTLPTAVLDPVYQRDQSRTSIVTEVEI